jgi:hypothetical protein
MQGFVANRQDVLATHSVMARKVASDRRARDRTEWGTNHTTQVID